MPVRVPYLVVSLQIEVTFFIERGRVRLMTRSPMNVTLANAARYPVSILKQKHGPPSSCARQVIAGL